MRSDDRHRLVQLEADVLDGVDVAADAVDVVLRPLARPAPAVAPAVFSTDRIDDRCAREHEAIIAMLALQAPVADDLRTLLGLLDVVGRIERVGRQCADIAELLKPGEGEGEDEDAEDEMIREALVAMGVLARDQLVMAKRSFGARDVALAEAVADHDREINRLNRQIFSRALGIGDSEAIRGWAFRMTLVARSLERIGDNGVDIGERAAFVATGTLREFADASHPKPTDQRDVP